MAAAECVLKDMRSGAEQTLASHAVVASVRDALGAGK
jgi:hypothetical protein